MHESFIITISMIITHMTGEFPKEYIPTVNDNFTQSLKVQNKEFQVTWKDMYVGGEGYARIRPLNYVKADLFLMCYSVSTRDSYESITGMLNDEVNLYAPPYAQKIVVGLKTDMRKDSLSGKECFTKGDGVNAAKQIGALGYVECSSLTRDGLNAVVDQAMLWAYDRSLLLETNPTPKLKHMREQALLLSQRINSNT